MPELADYKQRLKVPAHDTTLERAIAFHRARVLEAQGKFDDAVAAYKKVLELPPQDAVSYARLAALYVQRGVPRAAVMVYVALAETQAAKERWEKAAHAYERAADLAPDDSEVHTALRDVYIKLGNLREASKVQARLDRIVDEMPKVTPVAPAVDGPAPQVPQATTAAPAPPAATAAQAAAAAVAEPPASRPTPPPAPTVPEPAPAAGAPPSPTKEAKPFIRSKLIKPAKSAPAPTPAAAGPKPPPAPDGASTAPSQPRAIGRALGQVLLQEGMVTREQLEKAIQMQQRSGGHLGNILVEQGILTHQQLARSLSVQWGLPLVELAGLDIDPLVVHMLPQHIAHRHKVLPIAKTKTRLKLAISDPLNVVALDDVRLVTGLEIEPVVAAQEDIVAAIARLYGVGSLDDAMRQAAGIDIETSSPADDRIEEISIEKLRTMVDEAPIVRLVNLIINQAIADSASDIHVEPHRRILQIRYRVDGILRDVMAPPKPVQPAMVSRIKIMANMDIAERRLPQDGRIHVVAEGKEYDLRVSTLPTVFGEKVVMRILDQSTARIGLGKLGFAGETLQTWEEISNKPYGMLLVSGPTGSGKSTTLYSTLSKLNSLEKNILTIEDPVEYQLPRINQIQVNPKAGLTFSSGLRSFLRQDPDIIMVGEIRDKDTAVIAIQASLTGHLVLSTVHTNDAPSATTRLVDMGIEPFLVSSSLMGVLAQRLVRTICTNCKEAYTPPPEALHRLGLKPDEGEEVVFYRGRGCDRCKGSGYKGRIGLFELMIMTEPIRQLVLKGVSSTEIGAQAVAEGMKTLGEDGILKVLEGSTTVDELLRVVFVER